MLDAGPRHPLTGELPAPPALAGQEPLPVLGAGLLLAAGILAVAALFPAYYLSAGGNTSLSDTSDQIVPTCVVAAAWLASAGLVASRRQALLQAGAFGAAGVALSYFGLRVADLGQLTTTGTTGGTGLWLLTGAWAAGALGAAVSLVVAVRSGAISRPQGWRGDASPAGDRLILAAATASAVVLAVAFFPSWDRYVVTSALDPTFSTSFTAGDAFKNPGLVIAGNVWAGVAFGLLPIAALALRPRRLGAAVIAGVLVVALSQVLSAVMQTLETQDPSRLVPSLLQVNPSVSLEMTGWFDLEFAAVLVLALLCAIWSSRAHQLPQPGTSVALHSAYGWAGQPAWPAPGQWTPQPQPGVGAGWAPASLAATPRPPGPAYPEHAYPEQQAYPNPYDPGSPQGWHQPPAPGYPWPPAAQVGGYGPPPAPAPPAAAPYGSPPPWPPPPPHPQEPRPQGPHPSEPGANAAGTERGGDATDDGWAP